ncbi:MAG TPA: 3-phosphoshikimate 1-carboxyvinyltransferase [Actinomycetota bacterium]|nr:3-phosphoshikimate 1-carboxyvinyltransferase [Actinomycetota bacterium]
MPARASGTGGRGSPSRPQRPSQGLPALLEVVPAGPVRARLAAPASKSVTNRALACAALADGETRLRGPLRSDDAEAMRAAAAALGAATSELDGDWLVRGTGGRPRSPAEPVDARLSGTTMRFVAALATLTPAGATVTGRAGLLARPVGPLSAALRSLGAEVADRDGFPPVTVAGGGLAGGPVTVPSAGSSQFASAVLLVAPYARAPVELVADGLGAPGYVELTAAVMGAFGAAVERAGEAAWRVEPGRPYRGRGFAVEYDASAAAHLFAVAAATGGTVAVTNAEPASRQPDAALPALLAAMGATVQREGAALSVTGPPVLLPVDVDLATIPDQVTTVATLAALAPGRSRLRGVAVARGHETDRLAALARELAKLGVGVQERPDGLEVRGGTAAGPARLATHGDHRLAMAFAALAARVPGVVIEDPGCVVKTYPGFWDDLAAAGLRWRAHPGEVARSGG